MALTIQILIMSQAVTYKLISPGFKIKMVSACPQPQAGQAFRHI
jgi:hypothetical protein